MTIDRLVPMLYIIADYSESYRTEEYPQAPPLRRDYPSGPPPPGRPHLPPAPQPAPRPRPQNPSPGPTPGLLHDDEEGVQSYPSPPMDHHDPSSSRLLVHSLPHPHPFMGLSKFLAGRIHQMRSGKSYLAAHPSWFNRELPTLCPRCRASPETFEHTILYCKSRLRQKELHLPGLDSLDADSPIWTSDHLVTALAKFIITTSTGFPPDMFPQSPHDSPSFSPSFSP